MLAAHDSICWHLHQSTHESPIAKHYSKYCGICINPPMKARSLRKIANTVASASIYQCRQIAAHDSKYCGICIKPPLGQTWVTPALVLIGVWEEDRVPARGESMGQSACVAVLLTWVPNRPNN
eukprot:1158070-Pelagomonas_calceolata.AAC.5